MPPDGLEFALPIQFWMPNAWPKNFSQNSLMFIHNHVFQPYRNVSWHSERHFPQFHSMRHQAMQAVCKGDIEKMEDLILNQNFDINSIVDQQGKFTALSLACHLDKLEMVHFLDLMGADLDSARGKLGNTPLMTATMRWNNRIVEYLIERGVDPYVTDKYGFTAGKKAEMKQLKTITSMLSQYERSYVKRQREIAITNKDWLNVIKEKKLPI